MKTIVGVLLAAGVGERFDPTGTRLKLLEPAPSGAHAGRPLAVAAALNLKTAVDEVVAVVRPIENESQRTLHTALEDAGCRLVVCERAGEGIGASLACGVRAASDAAAWLIALADMPAIAPATIAAVAQALREGHTAAAPVVGGRRGHPVGFSRACYEALSRLTGDVGARSVLAAHPPFRVAVDDHGALLDIDSPSDLKSP
ncbi:MAG: nucleotidyltransferase family protein [Burkholderiaceae bacterium]